jgi:hypothetical protein
VTAVEGATFVPQFLDGSPYVPQHDNAYVCVRLPEPVRPTGSVTVYLLDGTALTVSQRDLLRLAPADDSEKT